MNLDDLGKGVMGAMPHLQKAGLLAEPPQRLAGRLLGLGTAEMDAGVPKWAWLTIGVVAGAAVMWTWGDDVKRFVGRRTG